MGSGPPSPVPANHPLAKHGYAFKLALNSPVDVPTAQGLLDAKAFINACRSVPGNQDSFGGLPPANGVYWIGTNPGSCLIWSGYNHYNVPNGLNCQAANDGNTGGWGNIMNALPPSSNHPGGVNLGMADGSVRFIKDTIAQDVWWALGTRSGGEVLSADQF